MAKYKAYPEYKDSGVEWLGETPRHWQRFPLKYLVEMRSGESITAADIEPEGNYPVFGGNGLRGYSSKYTHSGSYILIGRQGALCGNVNYAHNQFWASEHALVVKGKKSFNIRWLGELLRAMNLNQYSITAAQPGLSAEALVNLQIPVPPEAEREAVASFIDYEAGKIDNLIEKQQQLIELLKEKRQAVISHAVTKGLNPNVTMKDSGVEWLGEVPEHWVGSSLKYMAKVIDCKHITAEFSDVGIPVASISEVKSWFVDLSTAKLTNEKDYLLLIDGGRKPTCGDIIYSRNATVGEAAIVSDNMPDFAMGQDVCLIKTNEKVIPEFILYTLKSEIITQQLNLAMVGSTFKRINVDDIRNFSIAIPPKNEQVLIVKMLMGRLEKYDRIISNTVDVITYMQERRTALISAAVTGKIDVRDWIAPDTQDLEEPQEATA